MHKREENLKVNIKKLGSEIEPVEWCFEACQVPRALYKALLILRAPSARPSEIADPLQVAVRLESKFCKQ
jgi:hypothetical protein